MAASPRVPADPANETAQGAGEIEAPAVTQDPDQRALGQSLQRGAGSLEIARALHDVVDAQRRESHGPNLFRTVVDRLREALADGRLHGGRLGGEGVPPRRAIRRHVPAIPVIDVELAARVHEELLPVDLVAPKLLRKRLLEEEEMLGQLGALDLDAKRHPRKLRPVAELSERPLKDLAAV